jgi:hypothetical protein
MRIAQIALVVMVVIVGLLGYTKPGHRILNAIGFPNACKHGCSYASSTDQDPAVGGLFSSDARPRRNWPFKVNP